jgi:hypothetical protein
MQRNAIQYRRGMKHADKMKKGILYRNYQAAQWALRFNDGKVPDDVLLKEWIKTGLLFGSYRMDRMKRYRSLRSLMSVRWWSTLYPDVSYRTLAEWITLRHEFAGNRDGWDEPTTLKAPPRVAAHVAKGAYDASGVLKNGTIFDEKAERHEYYYTRPPSELYNALNGRSPDDPTPAVYKSEVKKFTMAGAVDPTIHHEDISSGEIADMAYYGLGKKFANTMLEALFTGDGDGKPLGILNSNVKRIQAKKRGELSAEDLYNLYYEGKFHLKNPTFMMHPSRYSELMGRFSGYPVHLIERNGMDTMLMGVKVEVSDKVPAGYIVLCDPRAFGLSKVHNVRVTRVGETMEPAYGLQVSGDVFLGDINPGDFTVLCI